MSDATQTQRGGTRVKRNFDHPPPTGPGGVPGSRHPATQGGGRGVPGHQWECHQAYFLSILLLFTVALICSFKE